MREEDDDEDREELRRYRKVWNEEWRLRMEKKMDEMENVGKFMMTNLEIGRAHV